MRRLLAPAVLVVLLVTGGCSSDTASSSGSSPSSSVSPSPSPSSSPTAGSGSSQASPLCDSLAALQVSLQGLDDLDVSQDGLAAVQEAGQTVQAQLQQVVTDAQEQYAPQVDRLRQDATQLRAAVAAAQSDLSGPAVAAVRQAVRTLGDDARALADTVTPPC